MTEHDHPQHPDEAVHEQRIGVLASSEDTPGEDNPETNVAPIREGLRRWGEPFLAYLILDGIEQRSPNLIAEFEQSYYGHWPDRSQFIEHQVEELGWQDVLARFARDNGIWPDELTWQPEVVWAHLDGLYRITERLGGVYVFRR